MEFTRKEDDEKEESGRIPVSSDFNPPPIRESAFSKPILSSSSSLLPPRGREREIGSSRNGNIGSATPTPPDPSQSASSSADGAATVRYRDCLRNHAASLGGHVIDGCGEFMSGPTDPMKCAACGCHRSFHRREFDNDPKSHRQQNINGSAANRIIPLLLPPPHPHQKQYLMGFPPSPIGFGGSGNTTESSSEERKGLAEGRKKRFRTRFTVEQKERMMGFAERVGWRVQKKDEGEMERFCGEVGVRRQVLKVWMHNNKHLVIRKQQQTQQQQQQQGKEEEDQEVEGEHEQEPEPEPEQQQHKES